MMERSTERGMVQTVAARWRRQYGKSGGQYADVLPRLRALDVSVATAADVAAIIGNDSWIKVPACDECGAETWDSVQIGAEPDYESATAQVCRSCLQKALALLDRP